MSVATSPALRYSKSLWSYKPLPTGCVLYLPLWHLDLRGTVFNSIDSVRHSIAVLEAVKVVQGFDFDGVDDLMTVPDNLALRQIWDGGGTVTWWEDADSDGESDISHVFTNASEWHIRHGTEQTVNIPHHLRIEFDGGTDGNWDNNNALTVFGVPRCYSIIYNSDSVENDPTFVQDGVAETVGGGGLREINKPVGTRVTGTDDLIIANTAAGTRTHEGRIMEVVINNRAISTAEAQDYYKYSYPRRFQ